MRPGRSCRPTAGSIGSRTIASGASWPSLDLDAALERRSDQRGRARARSTTGRRRARVRPGLTLLGLEDAAGEDALGVRLRGTSQVSTRIAGGHLLDLGRRSRRPDAAGLPSTSRGARLDDDPAARRALRAASRGLRGVRATRPPGTGTPRAARIDFAWYSWTFMPAAPLSGRCRVGPPARRWSRRALWSGTRASKSSSFRSPRVVPGHVRDRGRGIDLGHAGRSL